MALSESTKVNVPLSAAAAALFAWLLFLTSMVFQVKEDVAVIKAVIVPAQSSSVANK